MRGMTVAMMVMAIMLNTSAGAGEGKKELHETALAVTGMVCSSCSSAVELALKKLDGVAEARADVEADQVQVRYDESKITPRQMVETIRKAGYQARLPVERTPR